MSKEENVSRSCLAFYFISIKGIDEQGRKCFSQLPCPPSTQMNTYILHPLGHSNEEIIL
ncbi:MAG: hypothetical protein FWG91_09095 [Lachnospiraceae bacterium]|nr:hypothetical protein [Lachnospiraceae bacterium]